MLSTPRFNASPPSSTARRPWTVARLRFNPQQGEHYHVYVDDGTHVADVAVVWDGYDKEKGEPIASPVNALLVAQAPEMAALLRALLDLWPLDGTDLKVYVAQILVPAAWRILAALDGTTDRLPLGQQ